MSFRQVNYSGPYPVPLLLAGLAAVACQNKQEPHPFGSGCGRLEEGAALKAMKRAVHNVHTSGFGLSRTSAGLARIPHVFRSSQCLQGLECSSSPTSGTHNPSSEGFLL
jgi:hypothetical protein